MTHNCMSFWYPKLLASGVPTPETIMVDAPSDLMDIMDGHTPDGFDDFKAKLTAAATQIGYPCFLRNSYTSGKHDWNRTCFVEKSSDLIQHVACIIDYAESASMFGMPDYKVWAVRKYIPLIKAKIETRRGMPITKERRYFIESPHECDLAKVICSHSYYPLNAVLDMLTYPQLKRLYGEDWDGMEERDPVKSEVALIEAELAKVNTPSQEDIEFLGKKSVHVASFFGGQWSLDWAQGEDGVWYALDMALAKDSYHWEGCPHEKEIVK